MVAMLAMLSVLPLRSAAAAETRTWTDDASHTWNGEFLRVDGLSAVFLVGGKEYSFPLARLSSADKVLIFKLRHPPGNVSAAAGPAATPVRAGRPGGFAAGDCQPGRHGL